jgi:hypothetical protein
MSSRTVRIAVVCVLLVVGVAVWMLSQHAVEAPIGSSRPAATPEPERPGSIAVEPEREPTDASAEPEVLTAETLAGTCWQDDMVSVKFLPDGRWEMNGRICAQWRVEGSRVRIYDDKGEMHFVDIVGNSLEFNGKKIARAPD